MFFLYISLAYIIPNIYVFFRIMNLFITKGYRRWYILVYLIVAAIYPLAGRSSGYEQMNFPMQVLHTISGYLLPFYLYLFLAVVVFDIFLLINLFLKILPPIKRKSFSFRFYTLSGMVLLSVCVVVGGAINLNTIRISEYDIDVPRKSSKIDQLRIAFVADIHLQQNTNIRFMEQFVRKTNALKPDILLYGGDIVEGHREDGNLEAIESILRNIQVKYGSFAVVGNHEPGRREEQGRFFSRAGITLLRDSVVRIDSSFYLAGRYDQRYRQRKSISGFFGERSHDLPLILMDHRPTELQEAVKSGVDVQFSGHTHNGQLFPLNFIISRMYELSWGYRKMKDTHFFVTSGLRLWGPPVKTAGKSEIMLVNIRFK